MEELKKKIVNELYSSNFYEALVHIKNLENQLGNIEEVLFFYYILYDFLEWVSKHKQDISTKEVIFKKDQYFNKLSECNSFDKSITYLNIYKFLDTHFRKFERFSWFRKKDRSLILLNKAIEENSQNLEAKFYILFVQGNILGCFDFLNTNTLDTDIVETFLNGFWYQAAYLDSSRLLKQKYNIKQDDFIYYAQKKDYKWLYKYYSDNIDERYKEKYISFGKVCYVNEQFNEAIAFLNSKEQKTSDDYYVLGQCYQQKGQVDNAIECYKSFYHNFQSGNWENGIKKLFSLKAYDDINEILQNEKSFHYKMYKIFYEAKLFYINKEYSKSIEHLKTLLENPNLKKDVYVLLIANYYKQTIDMLISDYDMIISEQDFELNNFLGLDYNHYQVYRECEKYIKKLNIEFDNKYYAATKILKNRILRTYISIHKNIYNQAIKINFPLSENKELYYLSAFDDEESFDKRINIFQSRLKEEPQSPRYNLELGKMFYKKAEKSNKDYSKAKEHIKKAIELSEKYFVNLYGEAELLLMIIKDNSIEENKYLFDKTIHNFIFYNSYEKGVNTIFFDQILYKYQSFSINALSGLANNYLYFASPEKLNDPFDVASETLQKEFDNLELRKKDFKLCSLSKINDNKLMWSHYTQEHTGICVGYNFLYLPSYVGKDEVKYKNVNLEVHDVFENIIDYWTVKSEDWEYEQEVRLLHYGEREKIPYTFDINKAMQENIIALKIYSITLGLNFAEYDIIKQIINGIEKKQDSTIKIYQTKIEEQKLLVQEITL